MPAMQQRIATAAGLAMLTAALGAALGAQGPPAQPPVESGRLRLHYVQKPIGYERYEIARDGDGLTLTSDFDFTDRGGRVQLAATLRTAPDLTPLLVQGAGQELPLRQRRLRDRDRRRATRSVRADGAESRVTAAAAFFTVDGYAPFAAQMLLLRYWKQHGQPRVIADRAGPAG